MIRKTIRHDGAVLASPPLPDVVILHDDGNAVSIEDQQWGDDALSVVKIQLFGLSQLCEFISMLQTARGVIEERTTKEMLENNNETH